MDLDTLLFTIEEGYTQFPYAEQECIERWVKRLYEEDDVPNWDKIRLGLLHTLAVQVKEGEIMPPFNEPPSEVDLVNIIDMYNKQPVGPRQGLDELEYQVLQGISDSQARCSVAMGRARDALDALIKSRERDGSLVETEEPVRLSSWK